MSQLKAKQLKLTAEGDLLIGGTGGTGSTISATGKADQILRVVNGRPAWSVNDNLKSSNTFNTVTAADATGVTVQVQNGAGTAAVNLASFKSGSTSDENFVFSSTPGELKIAAQGTADDIDIVIAAKGGGDVIIGNSGGGVIQADDGEDLQLLGGSGAGNLLLNGGGSGKIYYADDATDPNKEIATEGDIQTATAAASVSQFRTEFTGDQALVLNDKTIPASIIVHLNGLTISKDLYAYNGSTKVITMTGLTYTLDSGDKVVVTYEITA